MAATTPSGPALVRNGTEFVIGVTGHRDIEPAGIEAVRTHLREVLTNIRQRFGHAPVTLVTGLAEGADSLAAEVALEIGLTVRAILPMPVDHYRDDFEGAAAEALDRFLADGRIETETIPLAPDLSDADMDAPASRDRQYQLLASYLSRRANLLIAIWDGKVNNLPGGTSDVALRYLANGGDETPGEIDADPEERDACGNLLIWVPSGRQSERSPDLPGTTQCLVSNANHDCYWRTTALPAPILKRWAGFDDYAAAYTSPAGRDLPAYSLIGGADHRSPEAVSIDVDFIRADQLARAHQSQSNLVFAAFALIAAAMGLAFLIYAKLLAAKIFLIIYVALFLAGFAGFRLAAGRHLHGKHLSYRALAETLRVQVFLVLSGAGEDHDLRRALVLMRIDQFDRFEWLREAIRGAEPLVYFGHCRDADVIGLVRERWINDQAGYFAKKLAALHTQHRRLETLKSALLFGSLAGALALILFKDWLHHLDMVGYDGKSWLVFFMGLLPLWVAIWELYQGKMATQELLWQYANQRRYFDTASRQIARVQTVEEGQPIARDLAEKALIETYLWSVHRYHREHEPPSAG